MPTRCNPVYGEVTMVSGVPETANDPVGIPKLSGIPGRVAADTRGGSLVEYIIVVGVVALLAIGAWRQFNGSVKSVVQRQADHVRTLEGTESQEVTGAPGVQISQSSGKTSPGDIAESPNGTLDIGQGPARVAGSPSAGPARGVEAERSGARSPPASSAREALLIASILKVMCPQDKALLRDLKARGVTVTAYDRLYFDDPYYDGHKWTTRQFPAGGTTSGRDIDIAVSTSAEGNALTLYHEAVHTAQPSAMPPREQEYQAYVKTEQWAISRGLPPHSPTFRKKDASGKEVADEAAIRAMVDGVYPGVTSKSKPGAPPEQIIGQASNGKTIVLRGDRTTYERAPRAGDSYPGDQKSEPATGSPIDMDKLQCP
jgi:Flp pilus assembly pilin Flp